MFCYVLKEHVEFSPRPFSCLHRYCEAGWVEQHEAVMLFREALPDIVTKKLRMTIWLGESEGHRLRISLPISCKYTAAIISCCQYSEFLKGTG